MKTKLSAALAGLLGLVFVLGMAPGMALAEDEAVGNTILIKNARLINMTQRYLVVKRHGHIWNLDLARTDPEKTEILSKYGVQVLPTELRIGDRITFKARDLGNGVAIPNHMYLGRGSHEYHKKEGIIVGEFYGYLIGKTVIAVAPTHVMDAAALAVNIHGDRITYHGKKVETLKHHWQLYIKGKYDVDAKVFHEVTKIKILEKDHEPSPDPFEFEHD